MKLNEKNQLGLNFNEAMRKEFYRLQDENYFSKLPEELTKPYKEQWLHILSDEKNKNLLFTQSAMDIIDKIKIDKFEASILKVKKDKKLTFLIDENVFYRVNLRQDEIHILHISKKNMPLINNNISAYYSYDSFKIMPLLDTVVYPNNPENYLSDIIFTKVLKMLIFTEYSEVTETLVKPNTKVGTRKEGRYFNESKKDFVLVDSTWNKEIVRNESFGVNGHFRLQRCGKNFEDRRLIYIREFTKKGYIRKPKKDNNE